MDIKKTIIAGIDLSDSDKTVIASASLFQKLFQAEKVELNHVLKAGESTEALTEIKALITKKVEQYGSAELQDNYTISIVTGDPEEVLIRRSEAENASLIILGRKYHRKNRLITNALIERAGCNLLLVPDETLPNIKEIVVPIDFSDQSRDGLNIAMTIAGQLDATINCLNVYTVPSGYHTSGKSYEEYAEIMKQNAIKDEERFENKLNFSKKLQFDYVLDDDNDPADKLYDYAVSKEADLVCIGSRTMSTFAAIFFASIVERLLEFSRNLPLLVVKDKKSKRSFLDLLRKQ